MGNGGNMKFRKIIHKDGCHTLEDPRTLCPFHIVVTG